MRCAVRLLLPGLIPLFVCLSSVALGAELLVPGSGLDQMRAPDHAAWVASLRPGNETASRCRLLEPREGAVLPANSASPMISWTDRHSSALVELRVGNALTVKAICLHPFWEPDAATWNAVRREARSRAVDITVTPLGGEDGRTLFPGVTTRILVDEHDLTAPISYLHLPIPFRTAQRHPEWAAWKTAQVSEHGGPRTFMTNLPVCANCHAYSADGGSMLLDMDVDGDKGGFVLAPLQKNMDLCRNDCRSWNSLPATPPSPFSYGLFASLSPDARHAAATVGETSLFVMIDKPDYSQLFFPVTGQIGIFHRKEDTFSILPGTTDPAFVHTGPRFSPDGRRIAFSRAPIRRDFVHAVLNGTVRNEPHDLPIHDLNQRYPFQFDLCDLPFPNPEHAAPRLLASAASDGYSHYFPRYSPDGTWIVFTRAPTGLVLQPASKLCIIPSSGGPVRELACNTERMNSWHSWSPDGRWMVFSAKGADAETELFLARMHPDGTSSAALRLHRLSLSGFACVVPEFLPHSAVLPEEVRLVFSQQPPSTPSGNVR